MPPPAKRAAATPRDWAALQRAYEACPHEHLARLADDSNIKLKSLRDYARNFGWTRPVAPASPGSTVPKRPTPEPGPSIIADGETHVTQAALNSLLLRLFRAIEIKLQQLELSMSSNKPLSPADHERQSRVIGSLTKNVEKVHELSRPPERSTTDDAKSRIDAGFEGAGDNAEQLRRELAARIQRLRERPGE